VTYELRVYEQAGYAFLNAMRPQKFHAPGAQDAWGQSLSGFPLVLVVSRERRRTHLHGHR